MLEHLYALFDDLAGAIKAVLTVYACTCLSCLFLAMLISVLMYGKAISKTQLAEEGRGEVLSRFFFLLVCSFYMLSLLLPAILGLSLRNLEQMEQLLG